MKYTIHTEVGSPAYLQLYKQVREDIVQGIYPHNTKLPSKRIIADEVAVSTVTVEHAYALLANGDFERHINRVRRAKRREIKQIK